MNPANSSTPPEGPLFDAMSPPSLVEFDHVRYQSGASNAVGAMQLHCHVRPGELVVVPLKRWHDTRKLVSLIMGLNEPSAGHVRFAGNDWQTTSFENQFRLRSRIGRVFAGSAWIQSLTVGDNVRLSLDHHRLMKRSQIQPTIRRISKEFSGPHVAAVAHAMTQRPAFVDPSLLQICQWIRAVCLTPLLLVLERPLRFLNSDVYPSVVQFVDRLRRRGTGVLWFAGGTEDHELKFERPITSWSLQGDLLQARPATDTDEGSAA